MSYEEFLTARDLMNYIYCPRIVFFERVLRIPQATTVKEYKGREYHELFTKKSRRAKIIDEFKGYKKSYNVFLEDKVLGFRTVLDCLVINSTHNSAYVVQVKDSSAPKAVYRTQKFQLVAEAHLVKEVLGLNVLGTYIKYLRDNKLLRVNLRDKDENEFLFIINTINTMIKTEIMPMPVKYQKRCRDCCFSNICRRV